MHSGTKKIGFILAGTAVLGVVLWFTVLRPKHFEPPPLPVPNGYDDFVRAGQLLVGDPNNYEEASQEELEVLVASNAPAFTALEEGLSKESRVPLHFTRSEVNRWTVDFVQFKQLAKTKCAEARLELIKNQPEDAANACIQTIRLGEECCRGGVLIHRLVGIAIKTIGARQLQEIYPKLDAAQCKHLVGTLESVQDTREPLADVAKTEQAWSSSVSSFVENIKWMIETHSLNPSSASVQKSFMRVKQRENELNRLLIELASRAYELEKGHSPTSAADLVPDYLKTVPVDLVTGKPMKL